MCNVLLGSVFMSDILILNWSPGDVITLYSSRSLDDVIILKFTWVPRKNVFVRKPLAPGRVTTRKVASSYTQIPDRTLQEWGVGLVGTA